QSMIVVAAASSPPPVWVRRYVPAGTVMTSAELPAGQASTAESGLAAITASRNVQLPLAALSPAGELTGIIAAPAAEIPQTIPTATRIAQRTSSLEPRVNPTAILPPLGVGDVKLVRCREQRT